MANSLSAGFKEVWANEYQTIFHKMNVAKQIADMSFKSQLKKGDTLNRVYRSDLSGNLQAYTRGTAISISDVTDNAEQLSITSQYAGGIYRDDFDAIQSNYDFAAAYGRDIATHASNQLDADTLGEWDNATSSVDDGDLGGTDGNAIQLSTSNVLQVVAEAKKKLKKYNIPTDSLFGVISPEFEQVLIEYGAGRDTAMGDKANEGGKVMRFYDFDLYVSNQLGTSAVLQMATDPTAADTVVINGVTFTAVTTIGTKAGNFLVGSGADTSRAVLAAFINDPSKTSANQVALTEDNQRKIRNCTATNDNSANTLTIDYKGLGVLTVSETLTAAADVWTTSLQKQHCLFGRKGAITAVVQKDPAPEVKEVPDKLGKNILVGMLYGWKTFADGAKQLVDVQIDSSSF
jgi:hypothetical protein